MSSQKKDYKLLNFYKKNFNSKIIFKKIFILLFSLLVFLSVSLLIRKEILEKNLQTFPLIKNFLEIEVKFNSGISFSWFAKNPEFVFGLQIISLVLVFFIFCNNFLNILDYSISLIFVGGLANVIDRGLIDNFQNEAHHHTVVDYLKFSFLAKGPIFNFADVLIFVGWTSFVIIILILIIKSWRKKYKNGKNEI